MCYEKRKAVWTSRFLVLGLSPLSLDIPELADSFGAGNLDRNGTVKLLIKG